MPKPTEDSQPEQRDEPLEQEVEQNTAAIADLDARVLAMENSFTTPTPPTPAPPGGIIDNTLPEPEEPEPQPEPEPEPDEGLAVVIRAASGETVYEQAGAENLGDYVDPEGAFVQLCYRAPRQDDALPGLTVWFRP